MPSVLGRIGRWTRKSGRQCDAYRRFLHLRQRTTQQVLSVAVLKLPQYRRRGTRPNGRLISETEHAQIVEAIGLGKLPPQHTRLGGEIYIHGHALGAAASRANVTGRAGCIALDNVAIQEVYELVAIGTRVRIVT